jgi:hypothetical protein
MGAASKVFSVILRAGELACSLIVLGIAGHLLWQLGRANTYADARLILTIVVASVSTAVSVICMVPFTFSFFAFPLDFILFAMWLVTFILLEILTGVNTCDSYWYYSYWGYYWGGWWRTPFIVTGPWDIGWSGCSALRTVLAFSFIASMGFLCSSVLGVYVVVKYSQEKKRKTTRQGYYGRKSEGGVLQDPSHTNSTVSA